MIFFAFYLLFGWMWFVASCFINPVFYVTIFSRWKNSRTFLVLSLSILIWPIQMISWFICRKAIKEANVAEGFRF